MLLLWGPFFNHNGWVLERKREKEDENLSENSCHEKSMGFYNLRETLKIFLAFKKCDKERCEKCKILGGKITFNNFR